MKNIFFICVLLLIANSNRIFTLEARESLQGFLPGCIFCEKLIPFNVGQNPEDSVILLNNWFYYWKAPQLMLANTSLPPPNNTMPPSPNFEEHEEVPSFSKLHHEHHRQHHFSGRFAKKIHMLKRNNSESNTTTNLPTPYPFPPPATHQAPTTNPTTTPSPSSSNPSIQFFIPFDQGGAGLLGDLPDNTELEALQNRQALRIAKNFALTKTNIYPGATFYGIATLDLAGSVQFVVQVKNVSSWGEVHLEFAAFLIDANDVQDSTCSWAQRETNLTRSCPQNWQRLDDGCF